MRTSAIVVCVLGLGCGYIQLDGFGTGEPDSDTPDLGAPDLGAPDAVNDLRARDEALADAADRGAPDEGVNQDMCRGGLRRDASWNGGEPVLFGEAGVESIGYVSTPMVRNGGGLVFVAQTSDADADHTLVRLGDDGRFDAGFGEGGIAIFDTGGDEVPHALLAVGDDVLLVGTQDGLPQVLRVDPLGELVRSFGVQGIASFAPAGTSFAAANGIVSVPGGYVIGGQARFGEFEYWAGFLDEDGGVWTDRGTDGFVLPVLAGDQFGVVFPRPFGGFFFAGSSFQNPSFNCSVVRVIGSSVDSSFGAGGEANLDPGGTDRCPTGLVLDDGRVLMGGYSELDDMQRPSVFGFRPDGAPNTAFGEGGRGDTFAGPGQVLDLERLDDGRIAAAGFAGVDGAADAVIALLDSDGAPLGLERRESFSDRADGYQALLADGEHLYAFGRTDDDGTTNRIVVVRYTLCP